MNDTKIEFTTYPYTEEMQVIPHRFIGMHLTLKEQILRNKKLFVGGAATFCLIGILLGLLIGWVIWPVQWTNIHPGVLEENYQKIYVKAITDRYAFDLNRKNLIQGFNGWNSVEVACKLFFEENSVAEQARIMSAVYVYTDGKTCFDLEAP